MSEREERIRKMPEWLDNMMAAHDEPMISVPTDAVREIVECARTGTYGLRYANAIAGLGVYLGNVHTPDEATATIIALNSDPTNAT